MFLKLLSLARIPIIPVWIKLQTVFSNFGLYLNGNHLVIYYWYQTYLLLKYHIDPFSLVSTTICVSEYTQGPKRLPFFSLRRPCSEVFSLTVLLVGVLSQSYHHLTGLTVSWSPSSAHSNIPSPLHGLHCFSLNPLGIDWNRLGLLIETDWK